MTRFMAILLAALCLTSASGAAAEWPTDTVKIIVPYSAGGTTDIFARYMGDRLSRIWSTDVIVVNRPGAGGNIASNEVANADPDGYTLLLGTSGSNAVSPSLYANIPYDAAKDLTVIAGVAATANVLVVGPNHKADTLDDLTKKARTNPGQVTCGSSGNGSVLHLSCVLLADKANVEILHVPYKGTPQALLDIIAGRVDFMIANGPSVVGQVKANQLKAIAVTTAERVSTLPSVPTMMESGISDFDLSSWFAFMGPSSIPSDVKKKINDAVNKILKQPETVEYFASMASKPILMSVDESREFFLSELEKWGKLVRISGAKID